MKKLSRTEYSLINIFTGLFGYFLNTIIGFVCRIIFVRTLAAEYLGVSGLFSNILSMLSLTELGLSSAIIYALYKPIAENNQKKINALMQFYRKAYILIGCVIGIAGLIMLPFLNIIITNPPNIKENIYFLYFLYLINSVISYFYSYKSSILVADQRNYIVTGYNYVSTIVQSILQIVFLLLTHEYISYLLIQIICGITYNISISKKASRDYPYIDDIVEEPLTKEETKDLFVNVKALAINKLSGILVNNTDNIVMTYFNGIISVGLTSNYILFSSTLDALVTRLFSGLTGSVGNLNASVDDDKRYSFFKTLNLANFWLYGWAAIGMVFVSSDLVAWFYGAEYKLSSEIPLMLAINMFTIGMLHASYTYKSTLGLFKYGQYILIFTGLINLVLDFILGRKFGIFGIYLATFIARLCTNLWYEPYAVYKYGLNINPIEYFKRYAYQILVLLVTCFGCYCVCSLINYSPMIKSMLKIIVCTIIPNSVFILCFRKTAEFNYIFDSMKRIISKILRRTSTER